MRTRQHGSRDLGLEDVLMKSSDMWTLTFPSSYDGVERTEVLQKGIELRRRTEVVPPQSHCSGCRAPAQPFSFRTVSYYLEKFILLHAESDTDVENEGLRTLTGP